MSLDLYFSKPTKCPHCGGVLGTDYLGDFNITHNLGEMADAVGLYKPLWRPEENGITTAQQLIAPLEQGIKELESNPVKYMAYDSPNGWGTYDDFVPWLERVLEFCKAAPEALVRASR